VNAEPASAPGFVPLDVRFPGSRDEQFEAFVADVGPYIPVPVPGLGPVGVPGGGALQAVVARVIPGGPPEPDQWRPDVGRLETDVLPVVQDLRIYIHGDWWFHRAHDD